MQPSITDRAKTVINTFNKGLSVHRNFNDVMQAFIFSCIFIMIFLRVMNPYSNSLFFLNVAITAYLLTCARNVAAFVTKKADAGLPNIFIVIPVFIVCLVIHAFGGFLQHNALASSAIHAQLDAEAPELTSHMLEFEAYFYDAVVVLGVSIYFILAMMTWWLLLNENLFIYKSDFEPPIQAEQKPGPPVHEDFAETEYHDML